MKNHYLVMGLAIGMVSAPTLQADWFDQVKTMVAPASTNATAGAVAALAGFSTDQLTSSLKAALTQGLTRAVSSLGQAGGFSSNPNLQIPVPGKLQLVASALQMGGQDKLVTDFTSTLNQAAEKAVPVAAPVLVDAVQHLTVTDATGILTGPDDAATQYLRRTAGTNLYAKLLPLVQNTTAQVGVTAKYKELMAKYEAVNSLGSFFGKKSLVDYQPADLDAYITQKTLDGLFAVAATEERNIRTNGLARTSGLMQKVFNAVGH